MKFFVLGLILISSISAHAQGLSKRDVRELTALANQDIFTATSRNLNARFGANVLCSNDLRIACWAFNFKPWEEIIRGITYGSDFGSEPEAALKMIKAEGECSKVRVPRGQVIVTANGEGYLEFRSGIIERAKVVHVTSGASVLTSLKCDLTELKDYMRSHNDFPRD